MIAYNLFNPYPSDYLNIFIMLHLLISHINISHFCNLMQALMYHVPIKVCIYAITIKTSKNNQFFLIF